MADFETSLQLASRLRADAQDTGWSEGTDRMLRAANEIEEFVRMRQMADARPDAEASIV